MHSKFIRLALICGFSLLLVHSAIAQIIPAPATPPPIIDPGSIIAAPPTPTVPPVSPPPIPTPTVNTSPLDKYLPEPWKPPPTPTVSPIPTAPPVATPTVPPTISPTAMPELPPTPPPIPTVSPIKPTPTAPPVTPPPAPTLPPINPPPAPTVPPVSPPPTPTIPPASPPPIGTLLARPDPQQATAVIRYGQGGTLVPKNNQGRFQKIALQPNQVVTVVLSLGFTDFGKPADVQILDGGAISSDAPEQGLSSTPTPYSTPPINGPTGPEPTPVRPPSIPAADNLIDTGQLLTVSPTGQLVFHFKPGVDIGLHRVSVIVGGTQYFLQFWRQNLSAPNNNPGMLRAY